MRWLAGALLACLLACQPDPKPEATGVEPPATWMSIPESMPAGLVHGLDFRANDARLIVNDQPGRQWVTISLSASRAAEPCAPRESDREPSVWIRLPGTVDDALAVRELERKADEKAGWTVHYQALEDGRWVGNSRASAIFAIRRSSPGFGIDGELAVCWADGKSSCVSGTFSARQCVSSTSAEVREMAPAPSMPQKPRPAASDAGEGGAGGRGHDGGSGGA